jgi:4-hydroxybenzoate polyprenyltransferase
LQAGLLGAAICGAYSLVLKRRPGLDVLSMIAWGAAMPMIGVPPGRPEGLWLVGQLALFSGVFESIQVMRDHDTDRLSNIPTTAVVLGIPMTRQLTRWLVLVAGIYAMAAFHPALGVLMMVALVLPIPEGDLRSYWNRMRALLGLTFLVECALVYTAGGS